MVFVGDVSGGLGAEVKDFWQSYPKSVEVRHAKTEAAELRVWLWSPDAPSMDLRHYDTVAHGLAAVYEDPEEDLSTSTPNGVARTSEVTLYPSTSLPVREELGKQPAADPGRLTRSILIRSYSDAMWLRDLCGSR